MDEPTTHLDVGSIDALIGALKQYHGTLIFISHDVHFIRAIATSVLQISASLTPVRLAPRTANRAGSKLTFYPGDYDYYLDKSKATSARTALTAGSTSNNGKPITDHAARTVGGPRKQKGQKRAEAEARNAIARTRREKDKRLHEIETQIAALAAQQKELVAALEDRAVYEPGGRAVSINRELSSVINHLAQLTAEWENVTTVA
jgi:ATP-binding cassette subfamily F protein 3